MSKLEQPISIPQEITGFYEALDQVHRKFQEELPPRKLTPGKSISQKAPLISFIDFRLDLEKLKCTFKEICQVISQHRPAVAAELNRIEHKIALDELLGVLVERFIRQDENLIKSFAKQHSFNPELMSLVLFHTGKPYMTNYANSLKGQFNADLWRENYCPVCGWEPALAVNTGENNQRLLHCGMCDTEWAFKSLACPRCLNEDHETLQYLTVESDELYRVNVCEKCKGYIKAINSGKLITGANYFLVDVNTLHLDILAEREGYLFKKARFSPVKIHKD